MHYVRAYIAYSGSRRLLMMRGDETPIENEKSAEPGIGLGMAATQRAISSSSVKKGDIKPATGGSRDMNRDPKDVRVSLPTVAGATTNYRF